MTHQAHGESEAGANVLGGLLLAVELTIVILAVESVGAYFSRSLALTVDAVHNLPDLFAFAASWSALAGTRRGSSAEFTYGTHRREVFAGLLNGLLVLGTGALFAYAAAVTLLGGTTFAGPVDAVWLLAAAIPTLGLRIVSVRALDRLPGRVRDLNLRGVLLHIWSDVAITGALLSAGAALLLVPSLSRADSLAALVIAGLLVYESVPLLRGGWEVLTERTPKGLSVDRITDAARSVPGVTSVHDVHVWAVCSSLVCLTAHVEVPNMSLREGMEIVRRLRERMEEQFGILHATFEIEAR
jgi:cobalt-zinc-cadmium efflux system protein